MFPSQTSFIPVTVALARFAESHGFGGNYPYWYFGTTPVKYLAGPVVPGILVGLHKLLPQVSFFDLSLLLVVTALIFGAVGWGIFAWQLSNQLRCGVFVGIISLILPWHWVSALALAEVSAVAASALTPWVLLAFVRSVRHFKKRSPLGVLSAVSFPSVLASSFVDDNMVKSAHVIKKKNLLRAVGNPSTAATPREAEFTLNEVKGHVFDWGQVNALPAAMFALLLLTNTTASIPAILGLLILAVVVSGHWDEALKMAILVIAVGWVLTLWWYPPGYWLTIFGAPSFGGQSAVLVLVSLVDRLRYLVPLILVIVIVLWKAKPKGVYQKFTLIWLVLFGSLTLFRFLADWDFWMDWTAWLGEVEIGIALLLGHFLTRSSNASVLRSFDKLRTSDTLALRARLGLTRSKASSPRNDSSGGVYLFFCLLVVAYLVFGWTLVFSKRDFWLPRQSIEGTVEYRVAKMLNEMVRPGETVFLSGTTAFWLNSLVDVRQVRGGRDEASVDDRWREVAWEVRQGNDASESLAWLRALGVDYLVIHTDNSSEYYHDFENWWKFEGVEGLGKVYEEDGDVVYKLYK